MTDERLEELYRLALRFDSGWTNGDACCAEEALPECVAEIKRLRAGRLALVALLEATWAYAGGGCRAADYRRLMDAAQKAREVMDGR